MDALSFGLGLLTALVLLSPALVRAYRAHVKEAEYRLALKVNGMVKAILDARDAVDPDTAPATTGRPSRQRDAAEALLMEFATARAALEKFEESLQYVKQGGHPDDRGAQAARILKAKKDGA